MINKMDEILAMDDYGMVHSKVSVIQILIVLISDMTIEDKLEQILNIFGLNES